MSPPPKSVLITGCSAGGIGASLALTFAKHNHLVFATARNPSKIPPTLSSLPNVEILTLDTTSPSSIASAANAVSRRTNGTLNYLINNAGVGLVSPFLDTHLETAREVFEVNFWGVLACIQGVKEMLVRGRGTVVNISSISALAPNPYESIYNASKAALSHFSTTLRLELAPLDIAVVDVITGMIQSAWYENSVPRLQLPEDSYYHPVLEDISAGMTGVDNKRNGMKPDVYAEYVVQKILAGEKRQVWAGALTGLVWWVALLPAWVLERICWDRGGLGKLVSARKNV